MFSDKEEISNEEPEAETTETQWNY
jgi:hypothetical protein